MVTIAIHIIWNIMNNATFKVIIPISITFFMAGLACIFICQYLYIYVMNLQRKLFILNFCYQLRSNTDCNFGPSFNPFSGSISMRGRILHSDWGALLCSLYWCHSTVLYFYWSGKIMDCQLWIYLFQITHCTLHDFFCTYCFGNFSTWWWRKRKSTEIFMLLFLSFSPI